jgi:hypothetical protein
MTTKVNKSYITGLWHFSVYKGRGGFRSIGYETKGVAEEAL